MANNDLISRSALIAEHCDGCYAFEHGLCDYDACGAAKLMKEAPAVDAVEVVRCRECKWRSEDDDCTNEWWSHDGFGTFVRDGDFCSCGERRADDAAD